MTDIVLEIGDFLGFCDLNGIEAIQTEQVQQLEEFIRKCNESANTGEMLVVDAIYDRLMEILRKVNPESELCKYIWEDSVDEYSYMDSIVKRNPMYSIQTIKSFNCDELLAYIGRLPDGCVFDAHLSVKLNGHGIRLVYNSGEFVQARSRARSSAGRDITKQLRVVLEKSNCLSLPSIEDCGLCEIRGEWLLPYYNLEKARSFNPDIKTAFSGVASMSRDSGTEEEWGTLTFVAYEFIADDFNFSTKEEEYSFLSDLGFETPLSWLVENLTKETLLEELPNIVSDCANEVDGESKYCYYTDGLVFAINDSDFFKSLGDDGSHYKFGNMALKVGYWEQNTYIGYIQTILWTKGKTKLSPVAIVSENENDIVFSDDWCEENYVLSKSQIENWDSLGVVTASGNRVKRIPLYEPNNMVVLSAYRGNILHFKYGGEAGVVPCMEDGTPLLDGRVRQILAKDDFYDL